MPNVTLGTLNTITVAAANGVYRLTFPGGFARKVDLLNTGAGAISVRVDVDPTVNGANTLQIPAGWAVNGINIDGAIGIGVIAAADTTISVRVT